MNEWAILQLCLVTWPLNATKATGGLALIQTSLFFSFKCQIVSITTTWVTQKKQWGLYQNRVNSSLAAIQRPGASFSKAPETFWACKAIFSSSVSKSGKVYKPETFCINGTFVHIKNTWIKRLCNHKVQDFAMAFWVPNFLGPSTILAPGHWTDNNKNNGLLIKQMKESRETKREKKISN